MCMQTCCSNCCYLLIVWIIKGTKKAGMTIARLCAYAVPALTGADSSLRWRSPRGPPAVQTPSVLLMVRCSRGWAARALVVNCLAWVRDYGGPVSTNPVCCHVGGVPAT
jgi:hypothetical protein